ncbi:unnamed protein product [Lupinus luteus]|uniref:Pollen Ole e 1 allergen and extensin family protein n=1 Tax=Lupinus luteus TaxID=3873 RepID=A0AAV1WQ08_LUPLU
MAKAPILFLILICFSFSVFALELDTNLPPSSFLSTHAHPPHHHHHHNHHSHVRAKPPTHYIHTTTHFPPKPSIHPFNNPDPKVSPVYAAFHGQVLKKSCKHAGENNLIEATPLPGAVVKVQCLISAKEVVHTQTTNERGFFHIESTVIKLEDVKLGKCKMFLVSAPNGLKPSNYNGGIEGALCLPMERIKNGKLFLFSIGPLAFEPKCP